MRAEQKKLYRELRELLESHQAKAKQLGQLSMEELSLRPHAEAWNVLECLEHLNRYGNFYLPECHGSLKGYEYSGKDHRFRSSWLGEYFAQSMWLKEGFKPVKTFKEMNPDGESINAEALTKFEGQLMQWTQFLEKAENYDWKKVKTGISIASWVKLRLGDTLRVVFYHNERHLVQAFKAAGIV